MPTREQYLAEAQRRGLRPVSSQDREQQYGTISARPGFLERSLPMAGQVAGGFLGGAAGASAGGIGAIPGGIAGATAGATAGRGAQQFLRARRGEQFTPQKVMGELGTEAAITGAAETALPVAGRFLGPVVKPHLQRFGKKVAGPAVENVLRFMTGVTPESTGRLLERGPAQILTRKMRAREKGIRIAEDFLGNAQQALKQTNKEWAAVTDPLRKNMTNAIPSQPLRNALDTIESEFLGMGGPAIPGTRDVFKDVRRVIKGGRTLTVGDSIPLDAALRARQQLDDIVFTGKAQGLLAPRQAAALKQLRSTLKETIHQTFPQIAKVDEERYVLGQALEVIEKFSPESVSNVDRLGKMIDAFEDISPAAREAIQKADNVISQRTGKSLLGSIQDRAASKAFEPTE